MLFVVSLSLDKLSVSILSVILHKRAYMKNKNSFVKERKRQNFFF